MKTIIFFLNLFLSIQTWASIIDAYGLDEKRNELLVKKYGEKIEALESQFNEEFSKAQYDTKNATKVTRKLVEKKKDLLRTIMKNENLYFVDFDAVYYPDNKRYITIEAVDKNQKDRLNFVEKKSPQYSLNPNDVIHHMMDYAELTMQLFMLQEHVEETKCPVYHCLGTFSHPKTKSYLQEFNTAAIQQKKLILDTLSHDKNPERRAAAAFLIGHFKNPKEIIHVLIPHMKDSNATVRNNVIRVIGETIERAQLTHINPKPFLEMLISPYETDRNKSLLVLNTLAKWKPNQQQIIKYGRKPLLAMLRLKQPNNHLFAYEVLKKLSQQDLGDQNIAAWDAWFNKQQMV